MAKTRSEFPHFIRIFSATALWGLLGLLFSLNISFYQRLLPDYWPQMIGVIERPSSFGAHMTLAQTLWRLGFLPAAQRELLLAQEFSEDSQQTEDEADGVLGASTTPTDLLKEWESEPSRLTSEYLFWQKIVIEKPDYRDAYVHVGSLAYQLSKLSEGKNYIAQAERIDPNNIFVQQLKSLFP